MGKPLRKPLPLFSNINSENRISTRNTTQAKNLRLLHPVSSPTKSLRSGEISRRSAAQTVLLDSKQNISAGRMAHLECPSPSSKRFRQNDDLYVLKNVNSNRDSDDMDSVDEEMTKHENSPFRQRCKTESASQLGSRSPNKTTDEGQHYDQNMSPSTSFNVPVLFAYTEGEEEISKNYAFRGNRFNNSQTSTNVSFRRDVRNPHVQQRLLPVPASLPVTKNGFELPSQRKSVRIQEKRRNGSLQVSAYTHSISRRTRKKKPEQEQIEIPQYTYIGPLLSVKPPVDPTYEDLTDDAFLRRHQKKEIEERRSKKIDLREQREQAVRERLLKKQMRNAEPSPPPPPRYTIIQVIGSRRKRGFERIQK